MIKTTTSRSSQNHTSAPVTAGADSTRSAQARFDASIGSPFFNWSIAFLEKRGREIYSDKFHINPIDYEVIHKLLIYFTGLQREAKILGLDLNKGICLTGPIGVGKTALFRLMKSVAQPGRTYAMRDCRDIVFDFAHHGIDTIHRYSKLSFDHGTAQAFCFDDLGAETSLRRYGDDCCVMAEILLSRYDYFINTRMITHLTTNYAASELEKMYGNRVRSRMREMFNLISFKNDSPDKR